MQDNNFIMCGFYCTAFIEKMPAENIFVDFILSMTIKYERIIYKYVKDRYLTQLSFKYLYIILSFFYSHLENINQYNLTKFFLQACILLSNVEWKYMQQEML